MHIRRNNQRAKYAVPLIRYGEVAVVKQGGDAQDGLEHDEVVEVHADEHDDRDPGDGGQEQFAGMEPERRCGIRRSSAHCAATVSARFSRWRTGSN